MGVRPAAVIILQSRFHIEEAWLQALGERAHVCERSAFSIGCRAHPLSPNTRIAYRGRMQTAGNCLACVAFAAKLVHSTMFEANRPIAARQLARVTSAVRRGKLFPVLLERLSGVRPPTISMLNPVACHEYRACATWKSAPANTTYRDMSC